MGSRARTGISAIGRSTDRYFGRVENAVINSTLDMVIDGICRRTTEY
jgi:hypothetical protein